MLYRIWSIQHLDFDLVVLVGTIYNAGGSGISDTDILFRYEEKWRLYLGNGRIGFRGWKL